MPVEPGAVSTVMGVPTYSTPSAVGTAAVGNAITYTITVTNAGSATANGVSIVDIIPPNTFDTSVGWSYTAANTGAGTATNFTATSSGTTPEIFDNNVTMPAGSQLTYILTATPSAMAANDVTQTAVVTYAGTDTDQTNNSATDEDSLPSSIETSISVPTDAIPGTVASYNFTVTNTGDNGADNGVNGVTIENVMDADIAQLGLVSGTVNWAASGNGYQQFPGTSFRLHQPGWRRRHL